MSCILYKKVDGKVIEEKVAAIDVAHLLKNGYADSPDSFIEKKKPAKIAANKKPSAKVNEQDKD